MTAKESGGGESDIQTTCDQLKFVVVGSCASGKTTMVAALREQGLDASVVAQEHSAVPDLWNHAKPDVLVYLDVDLRTVRERRSSTWSEAIYEAQQGRLQHARNAADVIIDTATISPEESIALVRNAIATRMSNNLPKEGTAR